ncbi:MAG: ribosome small subunit-dependent GTPase A [Anaerovoracaceae bacterium]|jgi:ribosome biogenesis GTPase
MQGTIVKALADFYYVRVQERTWQCKARGIFKKRGITPLVGDDVEMEALADGEVEGVVNEILPRRSAFVRPPVANVDQFFVVAAAAEPDPVLSVLDNFLVTAEYRDMEIVLVVNKTDLAAAESIERLRAVYEPLYPFYPISCRTGAGVEALRSRLDGRRTALSGPSGAGKSTLLNCLQPAAAAPVGEVSGKTGRGRHTTRHVEIFPVGSSGLLYDTPGFTAFDLTAIDAEELPGLYPEMRPLLGSCRYDDCRHLTEPGCAVRQRAEAGDIAASRYASYKAQLAQIEARKKY